MNALTIVASIESLASQTGTSENELREAAKRVAQWLLSQLIQAGFRGDIQLGSFVARFSQDEGGEWMVFSYRLCDAKRNEIGIMLYDPNSRQLVPTGRQPTAEVSIAFADELEQLAEIVRELLERRRNEFVSAAAKLKVPE